MPHPDHPELAGYEPGDGRPLRHPMTLRVMRVVVVLGVAGLVIPGLWRTAAVQADTAARACAALVASSGGAASEPEAHFDITGPEGPGWYCLARAADGRTVVLGGLGLVPG